MKLNFIILLLLFPIGVFAHAGEQHTTGDTTEDGNGLTLPQIYAITLIIGICIALIMYYFDIIRSRKMLYEMIGLASILLTIDLIIMQSRL